MGCAGYPFEMVYCYTLRGRHDHTLFGTDRWLLAWQYLYANGKPFSFITWLILTLGLFIAHGTNNLINDYTDFSRGIDKDNYFRTQYGVHPLAQGFWDKRTHLIWFGVSGLLATLAGIYALVLHPLRSDCGLALCGGRVHPACSTPTH